MKAVGYVRVSTEEQAREGSSLPAQAAKLRAYASLHEIDLVGIESDEGISAKTLDRPGLQAALAIIDSGGADGLLIAKLDRLTRSIEDWARLVKGHFGERPGKKLWSVSDHIDTTTAAGKMVLNILMTIAEWEREAIAERTRDALRYKIRTRSKCGPKVRYGSAIDPADPRRSKKRDLPVGLVDEPAEAGAIALMKELRAHGRTLRAIAGELTARGIPTRDGRPAWNHTTVRKILAREG